MEVSGQLYTTGASPQGKEPQHPLNRRLSGPRASLDMAVPLPEIEPSSFNLYPSHYND